MQTLVGALVDIASSLVGGVTLTKRDQVPGEAVVGLLDQLKHKPVRSIEAPSLSSGT